VNRRPEPREPGQPPFFSNQQVRLKMNFVASALTEEPSSALLPRPQRPSGCTKFLPAPKHGRHLK
jgi:hypothetical protein